MTTYVINCIVFFLNILYQFTLLTSFPAVTGGFKVLDGRGEEIEYGEKQTTGLISSLIFLSAFVEILAMITSYRNKAYLLICEKFQKEKNSRLAVRQVSIIPLI